MFGKQITDLILVANEIVDFWRCSKTTGYIFKLDVEKAFDKVNWDFLLTMLHLKGFHEYWINWIYKSLHFIGKLFDSFEW